MINLPQKLAVSGKLVEPGTSGSSLNGLIDDENNSFDNLLNISNCKAFENHSPQTFHKHTFDMTKSLKPRHFPIHPSLQRKLLTRQNNVSDSSDRKQCGNLLKTPENDWITFSNETNSDEVKNNRFKMHKSRSLSYFNPQFEALPRNECVLFVHIYNIFDLDQSLLSMLLNAYITITQDEMKLGKTMIKSNSNQPVWDQLLKISIPSIENPLLFKLKNRKMMGKFTNVGQAELSLNEFISNVTYHKYLCLEAPENPGKQVGILRINIRIQETDNISRSNLNSATINTGRKISDILRRPILNQNWPMTKRSISLFNLQTVEEQCDDLAKAGPLVFGIRSFENRYMGVLHLSNIAHPSRQYARRIKPLENQPSEMVMIMNQTTKCTEIRSPRLPWPTQFLNGASALDVCDQAGLVVGEFETAVLHITVVSVCGLRSCLLSKLLKKHQNRKLSTNSMHRGMIVTEMIANYQTVAQSTEKLSTYVQIQLGKDRFVTKSAKFTYDPVWNQTFTFNINRSSRSLIELQLFNQLNPNISGLASGIEKFGEAVVDISQIPLDFTQRIEIELNGSPSRPRILVLATLTGLTKAIHKNMHQQTSLKSESESVFGDSLHVDDDDVCKKKTSASSVDQAFTDTVEDLEVQNKIIDHYSWQRSLKYRYDVGYLKVKVIAATDLQARDMNGKPDVYCLLEVINMRAQTHTMKKNLNPYWNKTFLFPITDIHTCLQVTVLDVDKTRLEFLGKVNIPLLKIKNNEPSWYALKDTSLKGRAKGSILLEFFFVYNHFKAAWRTLNPPERILLDLNKKQKCSKLSPGYINSLRENVIRLKILFRVCGLAGQAFDALCSWENPTQTFGALVAYILVVWNFEPYMIPLVMMIVILINRHPSRSPHVMGLMSSVRAAYGVGAGNLGHGYDQIINREASEEKSEEYNLAEDDMVINNELLDSLDNDFMAPSEDLISNDKAANSGLKQVKESRQNKNKLATVVDILDDLPGNLDSVASFFERINGIFYWQVGWITWLCLFFLIITTLILYFVPLRIVIIIFGANRLTKHMLRPSSRSTVEVFNVISRVPSKPEVQMQRRLTPQAFVYPS